MRIEKIQVRNYRQYADFELDLVGDGSQALLIVGHMGAGKTNLLNAINWCLYGRELFDSDTLRSDPFVNKGASARVGPHGTTKVSVELRIRLDTEQDVRLVRERSFKVDPQNGAVPTSKSALVVQIHELDGDWTTLDESTASDWVERFLPERIRPYYLLNLERMQQFIHDTESNRVRQAILAIAQIDVLATVRKRLDAVRRDLYSTSSGATDAQVDGLAREVGEVQRSLDSVDEQIESRQKATEDLAAEVARADAELEANREAREVQAELKARREKLAIAREAYAAANSQLREAVALSAAFVLGIQALRTTTTLIEREKDAHRYPAPIDADYLRQLLLASDPTCICGTSLTVGSRERSAVEMMLPENIGLAGVGEFLMRHESGTAVGFDRASTLSSRTASVRNQLMKLDEEIAALEEAERIQEAKLEALGGVNVEVALKKSQRDKAQNALVESEKAVVGLRKDRERLSQQLEKAERLYKLALRKDQSRQKSAALLEFTERCQEAADLVYEQLLADARDRVSRALSSSFMKMMVWKSQTFAGATVDPEYRVAVKDVSQWESTGSLSGGENVCLAIAFGQALGEVSSFDIPPLIFDSPLVNLDATARVSVARTIAENLGSRQLVLLMKPGEFDDEVVAALGSALPGLRTVDLRYDEVAQAARVEEADYV